MNYNVAVVGCTGMVGRKFIEVLEERNFPVGTIYFFASARSAGTTLKFKNKDFVVEELKE
ncbi:segregation protein B, partial [Clostridiaceae bacterium UIB06]|nr:segregation protein B [Clostridiaceae bacterium UIB06]